MSKNLVYITNQPKKKVPDNVTYKALPFAFPFACFACVKMAFFYTAVFLDPDSSIIRAMWLRSNNH